MLRTSALCRLALSAALLLGVTAPAGGQGPPNWKGSASGSTVPAPPKDQPAPDIGKLDLDTFGGISSHLGRFSATGYHFLVYADFTFFGQATWTGANGDSLEVVYAGQLFPSDDPEYPFAFEAVLVALGGTGRLADARGSAVMTGGFTGSPGVFTFDFQGTLHPRGR